MGTLTSVLSFLRFYDLWAFQCSFAWVFCLSYHLFGLFLNIFLTPQMLEEFIAMYFVFQKMLIAKHAFGYVLLPKGALRVTVVVKRALFYLCVPFYHQLYCTNAFGPRRNYS